MDGPAQKESGKDERRRWKDGKKPEGRAEGFGRVGNFRLAHFRDLPATAM